MTVDSGLGDLLSSGGETHMALDSDESQIIASTKSRALEMLLGGRAESAKGYVKMI